MTLFTETKKYFSTTEVQPSSFLAPYNMVSVKFRVFQNDSPESLLEEIRLTFNNGKLVQSVRGASETPIEIYDVPFEGQEDVWEEVFVLKKLTLGEAMYASRVYAPEEKMRHNLVVAVCQTIRELQGK